MGESSFVERRFELADAEVVVSFFVPARAAEGEFRCAWTIAWPDREIAGRTCGEDGVQALLLAMRVVHAKLIDSDAYKAGALTLWGGADLNLPSPWGAEPVPGMVPIESD